MRFTFFNKVYTYLFPSSNTSMNNRRLSSESDFSINTLTLGWPPQAIKRFTIHRWYFGLEITGPWAWFCSNKHIVVSTQTCCRTPSPFITATLAWTNGFDSRRAERLSFHCAIMISQSLIACGTIRTYVNFEEYRYYLSLFAEYTALNYHPYITVAHSSIRFVGWFHI